MITTIGPYVSLLLVVFGINQYRRAVRTRYDNGFQVLAGTLALLAAIGVLILAVIMT